MTTDTDPLTKTIRLRPSTHVRLLGARIVEGETLDSIIGRALGALEAQEKRRSKGSAEVADAVDFASSAASQQ